MMRNLESLLIVYMTLITGNPVTDTSIFQCKYGLVLRIRNCFFATNASHEHTYSLDFKIPGNH